MSTTEPHRRGKPLTKPEPTVQVENGEATVVKRATVRRSFFGTGPFDRNWLNVDCCGLFCALLTYALHAYGVYAVCWVMIPPWFGVTGEDGVRHITVAGFFHEAAFTTIAILAMCSHFKAMTTDPGAVPPDAKPLPEHIEADAPESTSSEDAIGLLTAPSPPAKKLCRRCRSFKPPRAHHCSVCRRCIIKMDHHCPWVNNCVGIGNHKYFLLFVFYTMLSCIYSVVLIVTRFMTCTGGGRERVHHQGHQQHHYIRHYTCLDRPSQLINILGLMIEAVLFGMFTSCMMFDQWDVIFSKLTHIDRIKGPVATLSGSLAGVTEVFGVGKRKEDTRCRTDWFSPFAQVCFPGSIRDEVMGFCRPVTTSSSASIAPAKAELASLTRAEVV